MNPAISATTTGRLNLPESALISPPVAPDAERREMTGLARELARSELLTRAAALDAGDVVAIDAAWEPISQVGFDRALAPDEDGAPALDIDTLLLCLEELAAGDAGVAVMVLLSNAAHASGAIPDGDADGRWALVPRAAGVQRPPREEKSFELGMIEPAIGALGSDGVVIADEGLGSPEGYGVVATALTVNGGEIELKACGRALLGLGAARAARIDPAAGGQLLVARDGASSDLKAETALAFTRIGLGAVARGIGRRAAEMAREYAAQRMQGGIAIAGHDAVQEMLARMAIREASTPAGGAKSPAAAIAAIKSAAATATDAVQVFGGAGYMCETGVEKLMRDAKVLELWPQPAWTLYHRLIQSAATSPHW